MVHPLLWFSLVVVLSSSHHRVDVVSIQNFILFHSNCLQNQQTHAQIKLSCMCRRTIPGHKGVGSWGQMLTRRNCLENGIFVWCIGRNLQAFKRPHRHIWCVEHYPMSIHWRIKGRPPTKSYGKALNWKREVGELKMSAKKPVRPQFPTTAVPWIWSLQ